MLLEKVRVLRDGRVERLPHDALRGEFRRVRAPVEERVVGEHHPTRHFFIALRAADEPFAGGFIHTPRRVVTIQGNLPERCETPGLFRARGHVHALEPSPRRTARILEPTRQSITNPAAKIRRGQQAAADAGRMIVNRDASRFADLVRVGVIGGE